MTRNQGQESDQKIRVGITHGDFNGISYEIIIKTLMDPRVLEFCTPVLYGSSKVASYYRKVLNIVDFNFNLIKKAEFAVAKRANIVNLTETELKIDIGESSELAGQLSFQSLEMAVEDLKNNHIDVIVTAPINKYNIQSREFHFKGHTEYFADKFGANEYLMLMVSDKFRIGFATGHDALKDVVGKISVDSLVRKLITLNNSLIRDFGVIKPKIALLSINPHNGDSGVIGNEEKDILLPAIKKANLENILCFGPYPSDSFFANMQYQKFDAVMAMYHDQGMIPFKLICFDNGVNFTAGLSIIRSSPAHGVAYEIAGKNEANPESFRNSLYLACDVYNNRIMYDKLHSNQLKYKSTQETYNDSDDVKISFDSTID
jgi:4-hydroxythreonine-4-phosphate dehydrogenase